ncbi:adenosylcobinamide-GDP ribazoletransferase [Roseimaritima sediminicola]|uniref:adenosylcobinamide-GDP ribazoletransferase n=1 Tax=Roseimaritima sediminicola TaxID=2662066 RepID=UPI0012982623|nr:adenosylcobinamide-GDP ribazoletransferase [Roseimaritima sediminicola]
MSELQYFVAAVQFLTRLPVPMPGVTVDEDPQKILRRLQHAVVYFPLVGGLIGLATAAMLLAAVGAGFPPWIAALLALGGEAWLTGAFHEDALADSCDALGGGWTREQVLEIMRDSRLGTYGVVGLTIGIGLRAAALATILTQPPAWVLAAVVCSAASGRLAILALMVTTAPTVGREAKTGDVAGRQPIGRGVAAAAFSAALWLPFWFFEPAIMTGSLLVTGVFLWEFRRRILRRVGGTTGDLLGCVAFVVQGIVLLGATLR